MSVFTVALLGVGAMAEQHMKALSQLPGVRVVSCASRSREKAQNFAARHGIPAARLIDEVLDRPEADALWLAGAADAMLELTLATARCGLPLFLEKPVGLSVAETRQAVFAVQVPHMVGLNRRFYEIMRAARDLMAERGGVRFIEVHMPEDVFRLPPKFSARCREAWQFANSVHLVDLFRFFSGEVDDVCSVNRVEGVADRSFASLLRFSGGSRGVYSAQWFAPGGWRVALYGEGMTIVFQPIEKGQILEAGKPPRDLLPSGPDQRLKAGLWGQAEGFRELLKTGRMPEGAADLADYLKSVELVDMLTRSHLA